MDPFTPSNLHEAIQDLGTENKHNRFIQESLQKTICNIKDVIPGDRVVKTMPTIADIEKIPQLSELPAKGIIII